MKSTLLCAACVAVAGCGGDHPGEPDARSPEPGADARPGPFADAALPADAAMDLDATPEPEIGPWWALSLGGPGDQIATAADVSASGMLAVAGSFTASFDPGTGMLEAGEGDYSVFVAMMTLDGALRWATALPASDFAVIDDIAFEAESGDVLIGGTFQGRMVAGGVEHASQGAFDGFVARLAGDDGTVRWLRTCANFGDATISALDLVDGAVLVGGVFRGSAVLAGEPLADPTPSEDFEAYVARLAVEDGAHVWSAALGDTDFAGREMNILVHAGRAYIGADFYDTTYFGQDFETSGATDVILAEIDPGDGGVIWSHHYGGTSWDGVDDMAADAGGNLYVLGHYRDPASFGGALLPSSDLLDDKFVARYDADGTHVWSRRNEQNGLPKKDSNGIGVNDHEIVIAQNSFVSQFHPADGAEIEGSLRWSAFGFSNPDTSFSQRAVAAGPAGTLVLVGSMSGTLELLGPGIGERTPITAVAGSDAVIVTRPASTSATLPLR